MRATVQSLLQLNNIETYYGLIHALRGVSLEVMPGTITAILGNNGAGKSTILKTVMGLLDDQPDKGAITFDGKRINRRDPEKNVAAGLSYVAEGREVFPELTVKENLAMGAYLRKDRAQVKKELHHIHALFPVLEQRENQLAGTLSGGEQQMLAIARALLNKPKLLMMDEPSLGLAPALVKTIFEILKKINTEDGLTLLLVEQNANMALHIADYGYVLENGRIVLKGTAEELLQNEDVQEFYLGLKSSEASKGYQRWKRKKRWR
jgi:branched-chain amino acid transport system ATP-binding protein